MPEVKERPRMRSMVEILVVVLTELLDIGKDDAKRAAVSPAMLLSES